jgi:glyoxylase I family protein
MSVPIKNFDHFGVATDDFERSRTLYEDVLGLESIAPHQTGHKFTLAWYKDVNGSEVHITKRDPDFGKDTGFNQTMHHHVAFEVASLDKTKAELERNGFEYYETRGEGVVRRRQIYVTEPSGLLLELFEERDPAQLEEAS